MTPDDPRRDLYIRWHPGYAFGEPTICTSAIKAESVASLIGRNPAMSATDDSPWTPLVLLLLAIGLVAGMFACNEVDANKCEDRGGQVVHGRYGVDCIFVPVPPSSAEGTPQ